MKTVPERKIIVIDDVAPEANAMLQALYSRDPQSVTDHLERVKQVGPEKFMASYYVGYGHKSIGDCGTTTLYIEQVSTLAAKAIQDWPLYNGQEASTRYLDMSGQAVLNPLNSTAGEEILRKWMSLYGETLTALIATLPERFPLGEGENPKTYDKAIKAKAFDIARGLLPAGITTLLAWHTNLRQAHDHLKRLRHHPLSEIRGIADESVEQLQRRYPNSFSHKRYQDEERYLESLAPFTYSSAQLSSSFVATPYLRSSQLEVFREVLTNRPPKSELPHELRSAGEIEFRFLLDFGSFRDIQRHRSLVMPMPLLTTNYGFEPWYLQQFPVALQSKITTALEELERAINALPATPEVRQYYVPLGYRVACVASATLPAATYVAELRSGQTVHSTLRKIAQQMGTVLHEAVPYMSLYVDYSEDSFCIKRGAQDIEKRQVA